MLSHNRWYGLRPLLTALSLFFTTVRALEKARNSGQLSIDATAALLTSTDNLLSSSPSGDGLLESQLKQDPSSPLSIKVENNNAELTSDDEYSNRAKRRKRDI